MYDIIIVGAGPAGLTAAIYARRAEKSVLLIEKGAFGGQITFSPKVENYPGFPSLSGNELADHFVEQALGLGADVEIETVTALEDCGTHKVVHTEDGNAYEGKAVIIACRRCVHPCKQSFRVMVVECPRYYSKRAMLDYDRT